MDRIDRVYALLAGALWLVLGLVLAALFAGIVEAADGAPASPADLSPRVIVTEIEAGHADVTVYRGLGADLAVLLAPGWVQRQTRAVVTVESATGGLVFALDRRGRVLCVQTGPRDVVDAVWGGTGCGW